MRGTVPKRDGRAAGFPSGAGRSRAGALSWSPDPARPPRLCVPTACSSARRAHSAAALRRAVMSHPGAQGRGTRTLHVPRFRERRHRTRDGGRLSSLHEKRQPREALNTVALRRGRKSPSPRPPESVKWRTVPQHHSGAPTHSSPRFALEKEARPRHRALTSGRLSPRRSRRASCAQLSGDFSHTA